MPDRQQVAASSTTLARSSRVARLRSWGIDYALIVGWLALLAVALGIPVTRQVLPIDHLMAQPVITDLVLMAITVLPLLAYLTVTEAGPYRATLGKRRNGLSVVAPAESRGIRLTVRNLVKVAPWQFGHMAATRFASGEVSAVAQLWFGISIVLLVAVAGPTLFGRRGIHDIAARSCVTDVGSVSRQSAG